MSVGAARAARQPSTRASYSPAAEPTELWLRWTARRARIATACGGLGRMHCLRVASRAHRRSACAQARVAPAARRTHRSLSLSLSCASCAPRASHSTVGTVASSSRWKSLAAAARSLASCIAGAPTRRPRAPIAPPAARHGQHPSPRPRLSRRPSPLPTRPSGPRPTPQHPAPRAPSGPSQQPARACTRRWPSELPSFGMPDFEQDHIRDRPALN